MPERDRPTNDAHPDIAWRAFADRLKNSSTILAASVLVVAVLLSIALINRYRLRQVTLLIDAGRYQAARAQLDAMLPLFEGNRAAQYHRVMGKHFEQVAIPIRNAADAARLRALEVNAPQLADDLWFDAMHTFSMGNDQAAQNDWASAAQSWEYAVDIFDQAYRRANYANHFIAETQRPIEP